MITYNYKLSSHWLSALINGDYSGLEDQEVKELDSFLVNLPKHYHLKTPLIGVWDVIGEESHFAQDDISKLWGDCFDCTLNFI